MTLVSLDGAMTAKVITARNAMLEQKLRALGAGWALGYRLKPAYGYRPRQADPVMTVEWETHAVELVDGQIPAGLADFQYVTLKEDDHAPR